MKIKLHKIKDRYRKFAVIIAREDNKILFVRHKNRDTWELPGGHHEEGESILETGKRELYEETGALEYTIKHIFDYSVEGGNKINFGGLFIANVSSRGELPPLEIAEVKGFDSIPPIKDLTYGEIITKLFKLLEENND